MSRSTEKSKIYNFKVKPSVLKMIKVNARKYCKGNVSAWIKLAATQFAPDDK